MLYSRYLAIALFVGLLSYIIFFDKGKTWKEKFKIYAMMFIEGMIGGFIIDCIGVNAGYYVFPRQPFLSMEYFSIVIPCWGVFGMLINCLWTWVGKEKFWRGMAITLVPLFAFYEGTNLIAGSWVYHAPLWSIAIGWIPLVWVFAGCNRRRRVVHKIEEWKQGYTKQTLAHQTMRFILTSARVLLIIAMFPLLIAIFARLLIDLQFIIRRKVNVWNYTKCLLAMQE
jgi:hypothetical protein